MLSMIGLRASSESCIASSTSSGPSARPEYELRPWSGRPLPVEFIGSIGSLMHEGTRLPLNASVSFTGSQLRSDKSENTNSEQYMSSGLVDWFWPRAMAPKSLTNDMPRDWYFGF